MRPAGRSNNQVRPVPWLVTIQNMQKARCWSNLAIQSVVYRLYWRRRAALPERSGQGWITAEYGMLPRSTHTRNLVKRRKVSRVDAQWKSSVWSPCSSRGSRFESAGWVHHYADCDVLQADGGTRTASITGACWRWQMRYRSWWKTASWKPTRERDGSRSFCRYCKRWSNLRLEYVEDSAAETDMNVVMTEDGASLKCRGRQKASRSPMKSYHLVGAGPRGNRIHCSDAEGALANWFLRRLMSRLFFVCRK